MIAQKPPANLEQMDGQLAGLNQQLAKSASVLDELASIQLQFEDLAQTYADFKAYAQRLQLEDGVGIASLRRDMDQRFQSVEKIFQDAQHRFTDDEGGEEAREATQIHIENLENRLRQELRGALSRIDQAGFSPVQLEKLEKLDIQMRGMRNALRSSERRGHMLQNGLVAVAIMAVMALCMPLLMPLILGEDKSDELLKNRSSSDRTSAVQSLEAKPLSESVSSSSDSFSFSGSSFVNAPRDRP